MEIKKLPPIPYPYEDVVFVKDKNGKIVGHMLSTRTRPHDFYREILTVRDARGNLLFEQMH